MDEISLRPFAGKWIAEKDGQIVASAATPRQLVAAVHTLGEQGRGAVSRRVPEPNEPIVIL